MKPDGKVALVTGAGRGLGRAIALALAAEGAKLALVARTESELEVVANEARRLGVEATVVPADLREPDQIGGAAEAAIATFGGIDILVNNAGWSPPLRPLPETTLETWDRAMNVNARSNFLLCQACLPTLTSRGEAHVFAISTAVVDVPVANISAYRASKAAQRAFTQTLREEVRGAGVKVTVLLPEAMDTPMRWEATPDYPRDRVLAPDEVARALVGILKQPATVTTDEVAIRVL